MTLSVPFDNSYARLGETFFARLAPTPVKAPKLIALNDALARELRISPDALCTPEGVSMLAGNSVPEGADPLAQAYAGHQFGNFVPQLGDGRAHLLGEVVDTTGTRRDIQLKGSGRTPFSRMGDGRAWLGPVLREYIVSEAMHALGIPTTRALAAVETGETVTRERPLPGAVLTRIAASHIRVGTFQYFAVRGRTDAVRKLTDHVIGRHYRQDVQAGDALGLLRAVTGRQARLVARWMGAGFIHGVMNTDNCQIAGETIDYGPCAFIDAYDPAAVFSSIDLHGRYAYQNQPDMAVWNLAQFATSLLPLIDTDQDRAVEAATGVINGFTRAFRDEWLGVFRAKLGLHRAEDADAGLITGLLDCMARGQADFTNTFRGLAEGTARAQFAEPGDFDQWAREWAARGASEQVSEADRIALMRRHNPAYIPRNHQVERAITQALQGDYGWFFRLSEACSAPFTERPGYEDLTCPPKPEEAVRQTFCGT